MTAVPGTSGCELCLDGLDVHRFSRSIEWFEYIFHNRRADDRLKHR